MQLNNNEAIYANTERKVKSITKIYKYVCGLALFKASVPFVRVAHDWSKKEYSTKSWIFLYQHWWCPWLNSSISFSNFEIKFQLQDAIWTEYITAMCWDCCFTTAYRNLCLDRHWNGGVRVYWIFNVHEGMPAGRKIALSENRLFGWWEKNRNANDCVLQGICVSAWTSQSVFSIFVFRPYRYRIECSFDSAWFELLLI